MPDFVASNAVKHCLLFFMICGNCLYPFQCAKLRDRLSRISTSSRANPESKLSFLHRLAIVNSTFSNFQLSPFYPDSLVGSAYLRPSPFAISQSQQTLEASDNDKSTDAAASSILYSEPLPTSESTIVKALICDKTLAIIEYINKSAIKKCELFDLEKRFDEASKTLIDRRLNVEKVDFNRLQRAINRCQQVERFSMEHSGNLEDQKITNTSQSTSETMVAFWRGVIPGTKWCGLGDIAKDYFDIGRLWHVDLCCRSHDHCPYRLKALRYGYGLLNLSVYTRSHCMCDDVFLQCLKRSNSDIGNTLGNIYFNVVQVHCFKEEDPPQCPVKVSHTNSPDPSQCNSAPVGARKMIFQPPKQFT